MLSLGCDKSALYEYRKVLPLYREPRCESTAWAKLYEDRL